MWKLFKWRRFLEFEGKRIVWLVLATCVCVWSGGWGGWREICGTLLKARGGRLAKEIIDGWNSGMRSVEEI